MSLAPGARALALYERHLRRRGLSEQTVVGYLATARSVLAHVGTRRLARVRPADVRAWLAARSASLSPATLATETSRARCFFAALVAEGLMATSPTEGLGTGRVNRPPQVLLGPAAVGRLLAAASKEIRPWGKAGALRDRAVVELAYGLGLRAAELRAALLVDLDLAGAAFLVRRAKRGGAQALPIPPASVPHLRAYVEQARPVLAERGGGHDQGRLLLDNRGQPIRGARIQDLFSRVALRAGVRSHAHAYRRAVATHLVRAGVSVVAVQAYLGHRRLDTTATYVEVDRDDLRRAVAILER